MDWRWMRLTSPTVVSFWVRSYGLVRRANRGQRSRGCFGVRRRRRLSCGHRCDPMTSSSINRMDNNRMWKASETLSTPNSSLVVEVNAGRNGRPNSTSSVRLEKQIIPSGNIRAEARARKRQRNRCIFYSELLQVRLWPLSQHEIRNTGRSLSQAPPKSDFRLIANREFLGFSTTNTRLI
jgi:hypothetical protein